MPIPLGEPFSLDQRPAARGAGGESQTESHTRVAVLGGGLAGLTCALRVAQAVGRPATRDEVLVLEREPQAGGRIRSLQVAGAVLDLGALTFQPAHYPRYMALLAELDLADKVRLIPRQRMIYGCDGRATRADTVSLAWDGVKGLFGGGVFTAGEAAQLLRFYSFLQRVTGPGGEAELMALHAMSVAEWAGRFGFGPSLLRKFVEPFTHFCFRPPEEVSAAFGVFLLGFNLSNPATLEGGFGQAAEALAARLGNLVETGATVLDVAREPAGFAVRYLRDGQTHCLHSRYLVMAVPANVAAGLLPEMRERAGAVNYGSGRGAILTGKLKLEADIHLRCAGGSLGSTTIYGGEMRPAKNGGHVINLLTYRGDGAAQARQLFEGGTFETLAEYEIYPAAPAPQPGQTSLPVEWGDGLYMAGDCVGLFPSQETAVTSGEEAARHLLRV